MKKLMLSFLIFSASYYGYSQTDDKEKIERDVEVSENILLTLLKQQRKNQDGIFPVNVEGEYVLGKGVTYRIGKGWSEFHGMLAPPEAPRKPFAYSFSDGEEEHEVVVEMDTPDAPGTPEMHEEAEKQLRKEMKIARKEMKEAHKEMEEAQGEMKAAQKEMQKAQKEMQKAMQENRRTHRAIVINRNGRTLSPEKRDSIQNVMQQAVVTASKNFICDYGDLVSLKDNEKIIITTRRNSDYNFFDSNMNKSFISIEANAGDVAQYKKGKLTREQLLQKIKVTEGKVNTEMQPDLELLQSIFSRLYRSDLSKTYFSNRVQYENVDGVGATFYMKFYSSNQDEDTFDMPTIDKHDLSQADRDKEVKNLYPTFEKKFAEDVIEYGKTVKSIKDNESLVFKTTMTKCKGCNIPASVDFEVKSDVLKDYAAGKISKDNAVKKVKITKGENQ